MAASFVVAVLPPAAAGAAVPAGTKAGVAVPAGAVAAGVVAGAAVAAGVAAGVAVPAGVAVGAAVPAGVAGAAWANTALVKVSRISTLSRLAISRVVFMESVLFSAGCREWGFAAAQGGSV